MGNKIQIRMKMKHIQYRSHAKYTKKYKATPSMKVWPL